VNELPTPTLALSPSTLPRGALHQRLEDRPETQVANSLEVFWAKHQDEVRQAQRLRYDVFVDEMGARITTPLPYHDIDRFDSHCEHLIVRDRASQEVVGTYRALTPVQAKRAGCTYTDTEFELNVPAHVRSRMVELGRSCVHADYRSGAVILALWGALAKFMARNQLDTMIGCASIPMLHNEVVSGDVAASVWRQLRGSLVSQEDWFASPRLPLPIEKLDDSLDVEPPALIRGYLRLGAKILGKPAWDPDFNTADLALIVNVSQLPQRYGKLFVR
jgi:putative hemolysin